MTCVRCDGGGAGAGGFWDGLWMAKKELIKRAYGSMRGAAEDGADDREGGRGGVIKHPVRTRVPKRAPGVADYNERLVRCMTGEGSAVQPHQQPDA